MSFSWSCCDSSGKDLFGEFDINGQAIGLGDDNSPYPLQQIRQGFAAIHYKDEFPKAAKDAIHNAQQMVLRNIAYYEGPLHEDCPTCKCIRKSWGIFGMDMDQAKRFVSIPLTRVHRASGGW